MIDEQPSLHFAALVRHARADSVDVVPDVDTVGHGALVVVLRNAILLKGISFGY